MATRQKLFGSARRKAQGKCWEVEDRDYSGNRAGRYWVVVDSCSGRSHIKHYKLAADARAAAKKLNAADRKGS